MVMARVLIPTPLRKLTNDLAEVSAAGATVGEVLTNLDKAFPTIRERLFDDAGEIRRFILVHANGEDIRFLDGLKTPVTDNDEVSITPALAGG
jgi:sulfur-carrier protein